MYLNSIYSENQLKKEYRKKALQLHPDLGGNEAEFIRLTQEYKFWKKKLIAGKNDLSRLEVGDTVYVNKTECMVTYVDEHSFIAKAKGRVKYAVFDKKTGIGKYNSNYRAALMKEYFNTKKVAYVLKKIHTGFRLSKSSYDSLNYYQKHLGISRTSVLELLLTVASKDKQMMLNLLKKAVLPQE